MHVSNVLETQMVQRDYDGCWERIVKVMDNDNAYTYQSETGMSVTLIPEKWVTVAVYPFIMEEV